MYWTVGVDGLAATLVTPQQTLEPTCPRLDRPSVSAEAAKLRESKTPNDTLGFRV